MTLKPACIKFRFLLLGILALILFARCQTKSGADKLSQNTFQPQVKDIYFAKFDTLNKDLHSNSELMTEDLIEMKIIDTTYKLIETCYVDTTVQLNDSVFYSIISGGDQACLCSHFYIATLNEKTKQIINSKYLYADCDIDYSLDSYDLYDHEIISPNRIHLIKTMIFQKKERKSSNEDENIDHKEIKHSYFLISQAGQISLSEK